LTALSTARVRLNSEQTPKTGFHAWQAEALTDGLAVDESPIRKFTFSSSDVGLRPSLLS
jgi:hypothetical protein